ncbi:MAG: type IV toxin-antitoxin system AbiEi family antitoxin domain-containing protein [Actinomycetota bacterium]
MNTHLRSIAAEQGGVVTRTQALQAGYAAADIDDLVRRKAWVSLRRGTYMERDVHDALTDETRHLARVHAVVRSLREPAVVSHVSAAVLHGLPTWGLDLSEVHVTRAQLHSPRHEAGVHHHAGDLRPDETVKVSGVRVTMLPRTLIDVARVAPFEPSVVVADAALRADADIKEQALARLDTMRDWQGSRNAGAVLSFADGRSESVGESRCRVLFDDVGLPAPDLQREFHAPNGALIGRTDFYFEEQRTIGEFDGKGKYLRAMTPAGDSDQDSGEVVWREKKREDRLRELGYEVVRVITPDLDRPAQVAARFRQAFQRAEELGGRVA